MGYKDHELCEAIISWQDDYPSLDIGYVGQLYEIVCKNTRLSNAQRDYLINLINKYKIDVKDYIEF